MLRWHAVLTGDYWSRSSEWQLPSLLGISSAHYVSPWGCFATPFFLEEESYVLHKLQLHLWHLPIDGFQKGCLIAHQDLV